MSQTLDIKSQSAYKYDDLICRGCRFEDHPGQVINCDFHDQIELDVDMLAVDKFELDQATKCNLIRVALRMHSFLDRVSNFDEGRDGED